MMRTPDLGWLVGDRPATFGTVEGPLHYETVLSPPAGDRTPAGVTFVQNGDGSGELYRANPDHTPILTIPPILKVMPVAGGLTVRAGENGMTHPLADHPATPVEAWDMVERYAKGLGVERVPVAVRVIGDRIVSITHTLTPDGAGMWVTRDYGSINRHGDIEIQNTPHPSQTISPTMPEHRILLLHDRSGKTE